MREKLIGVVLSKIMRTEGKNIHPKKIFKKGDPQPGLLFIDTPRRICLLLVIIPFISYNVNI
ncbi:hypothetical protein D2962_01920 [Biomaibacter acetigenes]|jgi:hypothetical protein|uniref:Uncharacterized protein n=1 Tax=Biomaibacter acetigenes TaxID=2316383 RepID=A0A3G2R3K8_9FIRM|nr:hypothetical protein D2962_01920 [Biomaibacter acetigenes]